MNSDDHDDGEPYDIADESRAAQSGFKGMPVGPLRAELDAKMADDAAHPQAEPDDIAEGGNSQRRENPEIRGRRDPSTGLLFSQLAFLTAFRLIPHETMAARKAGLSISSVQHWRSGDKLFQQAFAEAFEAATGALFTSMWISAVEGDVEAVYQGGIRVGYKRKFDPKMREMLAKATMPALFDKKSLQGPSANITIKASPAQIADVVRRLSPTRQIHDVQAVELASLNNSVAISAVKLVPNVESSDNQ